jgi:hypothetical protein
VGEGCVRASVEVHGSAREGNAGRVIDDAFSKSARSIIYDTMTLFVKNACTLSQHTRIQRDTNTHSLSCSSYSFLQTSLFPSLSGSHSLSRSLSRSGCHPPSKRARSVFHDSVRPSILRYVSPFSLSPCCVCVSVSVCVCVCVGLCVEVTMCL